MSVWNVGYLLTHTVYINLNSYICRNYYETASSESEDKVRKKNWINSTEATSAKKKRRCRQQPLRMTDFRLMKISAEKVFSRI